MERIELNGGYHLYATTEKQQEGLFSLWRNEMEGDDSGFITHVCESDVDALASAWNAPRPAEAALAAEVESLKGLLKTAADFIRGMPSECMGTVKGEEHDFCAEPDHYIKDEFLHYVDAALAKQKQEG